MKLITIILFHLACYTTAQEITPTDPKATALEKIFSSIGDKQFPTALDAAKKIGLHPQVLLEVEFLHNVDQRNDKAIAAMAPKFIAMSAKFNADNSEVFSLKEDWVAVAHYTQALAALEKNDKNGFKKHITEAFWLSPKQAQAFAPHIDQLRLDETMARVTLDPNRALKEQESRKEIKLGEILANRKAVVFHFWSPMSQEVQINMPDFILTSQACDDQNIGVASILVGKYPGIIQDAETLRKEDAAKATCDWLTDSEKDSLSNTLRISEIPTMVIVSPNGKILFNGNPSNSSFWDALKKVSPAFKRPNNSEHTDTGMPQLNDRKKTGP